MLRNRVRPENEQEAIAARQATPRAGLTLASCPGWYAALTFSNSIIGIVNDAIIGNIE
jgi:hypothetical protein